jgi:glycosyltransferase involved in cell wall biosynthesis
MYHGRLNVEDYTILQGEVVLVGHPFVPIGMGEHLRCSFRAFRSVGAKIGVRDIYGMKYDDLDIEKEVERYIVRDFASEINIFYINANEVEQALEHLGGDLPGGAYNVIYPMWELSRYPAVWAEQLNRFDEVWAASKFTCESFLFFFDFTSYIARKNPFAVLQAFEELCKKCPSQDLFLIIKFKGGETSEKDYESFSDYISRYKNRVLVIDKTLTDNETKNLVRCCDCFVSLHRSEGVGLGLSAAMFLKKPVVATGYSGNLDFMTEENSCLVRYDLCNVPDEAYPFAEGQVWAEPDIGHAVDHMLKLVSDRDYAREVGESASRDIRVNFSWRAAGLRYVRRIAEIVH